MRLYLRSLAQLWRGPLIAAVVIGVFVPLAVVSYRGIDVSAFDALPDAVKMVMGIAEGASAETLAYILVLGTYGGLTLSAVAIAMCTSAAAGEEDRRTLPLVLSTPISRLRYIGIRSLAALTIILVAAGIVLAASLLTAELLDVGAGESHFIAQWTHLLGAVLFHGFLGFAIAAATGRKALANAVAALVMVVGLFSAGLLPMMEEAQDLAEWVPWYWLDGSMPIANGFEATHLALLGGGFALFALAGIAGFPRRDLRNFAGGGLFEKLAGSAPGRALGRIRLSSRGIWTHTLGRNVVLTAIITLIMFGLMGVAMGPLYAAMEEQLAAMSESMSADVLALFGAGDFSTPEGFFQAETLGMMAPIAVIAVGVAMAAGLAAEERERRAGLLLAQPVSRVKVLSAVVVAMVVHVAVVAGLTAFGIWLGSSMAGLGIQVAGALWAAVLIFGIGVAISAVALAVAAATGSVAAATWSAVGVAVVAHFANALMTLDPDSSGWAWLSPFNWYSHVNPLQESPDPVRVAALYGVAVLLVAVSYPLYQRRDLRLR